MAAALLTHDRQSGSAYVEHAKDIGGELPLGIARCIFFEGCKLPITGIVDQHIDASKTRNGSLNRRYRLVLPGNVKLHRKRSFGGLRDELIQLFEPACADHYIIASSERGLSNRRAEAARSAGNEPGSAHFIFLE